MKIALADWRTAVDLEQTLTASERWPSITWQGQKIDFKTPVQLSLQLAGQKGSLLVHGEITADLELACSRCTKNFLLPIRYQVDEVISLSDEDDQHEYWDSPFLDRERDELDLSGLSLQVLLENLPLQPLCRPDCRGLCPKCGRDQNSGSCDCQTEEIDPRLAILGQLLKQDNKPKE